VTQMGDELVFYVNNISDSAITAPPK